MADQPAGVSSHVDYGIDAPGVIRTLAICGILCLVIAFALPSASP